MKRSDVFPSKYLSADDLDGDAAVQIRDAEMVTLENRNGESEEKLTLYFEQLDKALIVNQTNWDSIETLHGEDSDDWVGCWITLFPTKVQFGSKRVNGIRIKDKAPTPPKSKTKGGSGADDVSDDDIPF